jgi:ribosomal protein S27E
MKRSEFCEESFWAGDCPECGNTIETHEDPDGLDEVECEYCGDTIPLEDDDED